MCFGGVSVDGGSHHSISRYSPFVSAAAFAIRNSLPSTNLRTSPETATTPDCMPCDRAEQERRKHRLPRMQERGGGRFRAGARLVLVHCGHVVRRNRDARWHAEAAVCATPVGTCGGEDPIVVEGRT